ncbi:NAD-binding protein [Eggerthellaceae bacterium zg-887]|uniref:NAD(P)-binding domain-containing protein n=1 Tax=Xiamenia xianingshaonis TaxID=2682776 RepID=UPI001409B3B1|nr:NAD(P)-binding domain-containing protein [Xiamenia xianingshaonis]NHM15924.1 NAD-binding protein [Xiamenia xianingshaonis]
MSRTYAFVGHPGACAALSRRLEEAGFEPVDDVAEAEAVLTFCTSQTHLEDVYFDSDGLIQRAAPGTLLIDLSASTPNFARELNAIAVVNDVMALEAPLAAIDLMASDAFSCDNLMCFVGGEDKEREAGRPFVDALAATVVDAGTCGAAQLAKAVRSMQVTAQVVAAVEADALCRSMGTASLSCRIDDIAGTAGTPLSAAVGKAVREERFDGPFAVEMLMADITAALTAADDAELILPQAEAAQRLLELLAVIGGADRGVSSLALVYRDEEAAARAGLDWSRAETAFGTVAGVDDYDEDFGDLDGVDEGGYQAFGFGSYSAN